MRTRLTAGLLLLLGLSGCFKAPRNDTVTPGNGLVVVIVEDETRQEPLSSGQVVAIGSASVQDYLDLRCVKKVDGSPAEHRKYHKGTDVSQQPESIQKLHAKVVEKMDKDKSSEPYIGIRTNRKTAIGPVPNGEQAMLDLLKKYGG